MRHELILSLPIGYVLVSFRSNADHNHDQRGQYFTMTNLNFLEDLHHDFGPPFREISRIYHLP